MMEKELIDFVEKSSGFLVRIKASKSTRTFTIRFYEKKKLMLKYRTHPLLWDEFDYRDMHYTESDWKHFITKANSEDWRLITFN